MTNVVGIRFQKLGKLYHFDTGHHSDVAPGDHVIVETKRGHQLGQVIAHIPEEKVFSKRRLRTIGRKATPRDLVMQQVWQEKELGALIACREQAHELSIRDAKFVKAEYSFDGAWLTFYYATENKKLKLHELRRALNRQFDARIELQLVGPRDVAKFLGGHGACGIPRCCSTFLTDFSPISIRMAKEQGISLNPQEITGMCGRLRCCLIYEYEQYVEARKSLPKRGKRIGTPWGEAVVKDILAMRDAVVVEVEGERREVEREQIEPLEELEALKKKAEEGCKKGEEGGCTCGAR
ncbi:MAG: regulatory iron-sulfur-containing complex subunit RicT [Candidatus Promineifilaceae bacterium]|nr:regulatory iron-sulfur-containing complex subunit RicT [Candidatus Promineifilaceae bacterium]